MGLKPPTSGVFCGLNMFHFFRTLFSASLSCQVQKKHPNNRIVMEKPPYFCLCIYQETFGDFPAIFDWRILMGVQLPDSS